MRCNLAVVAKDIILAHDTGLPSAINIIEGIQASGFPTFIQNISFLTVWVKDANDQDEHKGSLAVRLNGKDLIGGPLTIAFRDKPTIRNITEIQGLVIPEPGNLEFRIEFNGAVASYQIAVSLQRQVETTQANQPELVTAGAQRSG